MAFVIQVQVDTSQAQGKPAQVAGELDKLTAAESRAAEGAKRVKDGLAGVGDELDRAKRSSSEAGDAVNKHTGLTGRQMQMLESIRGPLREYAENIRAVNSLMQIGHISEDEYTQAIVRLQHASRDTTLETSKWAIELQRQQQMLDRIAAPMREYEENLAAVQALYEKDKISAQEYALELDRIAKKAGLAYGPDKSQAGPSGIGGAPPSAGAGSLEQFGSQFGATTGLLAAAAGGGAVVALGQQLEGLIKNFYDIEDAATRASNAVQRFVDANHSVDEEINQQLSLGRQLHATFTQTIGLYGRLAESADALSLSNSEIVAITKEFGEAVQIAGKPLDAADGIMRRFAYGMAAGKIETREMRTLMREMPAIADVWTKAFGATRQELITMVKDGRVSTEDLMRALLAGGDQIDTLFGKLKLTHEQARAQYDEEEKILSQRYGVGAGAGHLADQQVQAFKEMGLEQLKAIADTMGPLQGAAAEALRQRTEESKARVADLIEDAKNLTGVFRPLGDAYREWTGDTAAVRAEIIKINEPLEAAKSELANLQKAFEVGKVDVVEYTKKWSELQTTINHGIGPQALKITEPIRQAKLELNTFLNEIEAGADVTQAEYRKAFAAYQTQIHGGVIPEDLKLNNPKLEATDAIRDLVEQQKAGKITAEAFRKEYDALITTMNDGRLPSVIKLWEGFTLPLRDIGDDIAGLNALFRAGRVDAGTYNEELAKLTSKIPVGGDLNDLGYRQGRGLIGGRKIGGVDVSIGMERLPQFAETAGVAGRGDIQSAIAQIGNTGGPAVRELADQLERARQIANETVAPLVKYENTLKDIDVATRTYGLTQEEASVQQRKAYLEYQAAEEALHKIKSPLEAYQLTLRHLDDQLAHAEISQSKYSDAVARAKEQLLTDTGADKTFAGQMELQWIKLKQDAESFGSTVAQQVVGDIGKLSDALVTAANGGQVSWSSMADAMLQDLERVALRALEVKAIMGIIGAFSGGGEGYGAALASDGLAHFASGGTFTVGGTGGVDSQTVAFRATPGEVVTVSTPGAYPHSGTAFSAGPQSAAQIPAPVIRIVNAYDRSYGIAALDSRQGQQTVINALRANQGAVRSYSGTRR